MKSAIVKHSVVIGGHKTSVSLEDAFWGHLRDIARSHHRTLGKLIAEIDEDRERGNLSSAIRVFVLEYFREKAVRAQKSTRPASKNEPLLDADA
jgi:predicted DNA-binding ribbon-helix-helix protein